jgi:predicted secreted protein
VLDVQSNATVTVVSLVVGDQRATDNIVCSTVQITPAEAVRRHKLAWFGMAVESIEAPGHSSFHEEATQTRYSTAAMLNPTGTRSTLIEWIF